MSISDVSELVVEAARISGRGDLPSYAKMLLGFLEDHLNTELRVRDMVATTSLTTDSSGEVALPSDYLETIILTYGTDERVLDRLTREIHGTGVAGYYIDGDNLVSSETGTAHALTYYQAIPGLWANGTNWLLTDKPEVYLRGLVYEAHKDANNADEAVKAKLLLDMAIGELRQMDTSARRIDTVTMPRTQI